MYAVGHLALGYLTGKAASKSLNVDINLPLLFLASIIPDIDALIPGLEHRGPLHSVILFCLIFLPIFLLYKKRAVPYFVAVILHIIIGDYLTGGNMQLLWPVTTDWYIFPISSLSYTSFVSIFLESTLFILSIAVMLKTRDAMLLFQHHSSNLLLSIPMLAVFIPTFLGFPISVPIELIVPHLACLVFFSFSIFVDFKFVFARNSERQ